MLVFGRSFDYAPRDALSGEFYCTLPELVLMKSFPYTPRAGFSEGFLLHPSSWLSFSYTRRASFSEGFVFHSW